jgi:hypothetical protein
MVWIGAIAVAALGSWIMFDALPGINWGLWTIAASAGLIAISRSRGRLDRSLLVMLGTACLVAITASITADPVFNALACLGVFLFLAMAMLLAVDPGLDRVSAFFVLSAPFIAGGTALAESFARTGDITRGLKTDRARGTVRGIVITVPIVIVFALLLSSADPTFASWRDAVARIIETWSFIPRTIFFLVLLTIVLGAYSFAAFTPATVRDPSAVSSTGDTWPRWLGHTERSILLSAVTALLWLFLFIQLSYLFGNVPSVAGSGMTFAEYAQRGFGELTIVATLSIALIIVSERYGRVDGSAGRIKGLTLALILAVLIILGSAFRRVLLYEAAYGYTVSRLYAQVYMIVLAIALFALAYGVMTVLDTRALFRRVFAVAVAACVILVLWNHEGWIASENIERFRTTGKLDEKYLARMLSPNAVPVIISRMAALPEPQQLALRQQLVAQYGQRERIFANRWFEWNYRRNQAREALINAGILRIKS